VATVELARGRDTVRVPLELSLGVLGVGEARVAVAASDRPDSLLIGTAVPGSGTPYAWWFPNGTKLTLTGEREGQYRVRLGDGQTLWVNAREVRLLPAGTPAPAGWVGAVRVTPAEEWVDVRLGTSDRFPFRVTADSGGVTVEVYGAESRTNWLYYGPEDPFVREVRWEQPRDDLYRVRVALDRPAWGWKAFWDANGALVVRIRRTPRVDPRRPLAGLTIAVDAGHPPGGASGPTGLTEAEATLAVAKRLRRMLEGAGARVVETRPDMEPLGVNDRTPVAEREDAHLLVSIHFNAFPDGVNPFANNGTTVFYHHPRSLPLARRMQREILRAFGLRNLGVGLSDLALTRNPWFPSVLTESLFMMVPEQEAAIRTADGQERLARAHLRAIEGFVREAAER
jgi:N-acetylmuramoyl-L-alanine amidase